MCVAILLLYIADCMYGLVCLQAKSKQLTPVLYSYLFVLFWQQPKTKITNKRKMSLSSSNLRKLKTNLNLCIQRLKLLEKKKTELTQKSRKEIADYMTAHKVERARIRVEHIIREDYLVEAMEIVEMYCDTLIARFGIIEHMKTIDEGIELAVSSLIWITPRMASDVPELKTVADLLTAKYGKPFAEAARENRLQNVNENLMLKMGVLAPPKILVERYLIEIAKSLNVAYEPDAEILREAELYRNSGNSSSGGNGNGNVCATLPPHASQASASVPEAMLLDLGKPISTSTQSNTAHAPLPPPLPSIPPVASISGANESKMTNETQTPSAPPIGTQSLPPSYDSLVVGGGDTPFAPQSSQPPHANEDELYNLPDVPVDEEEDDSNTAGKDISNNNDHFDDLRRRFAQLKNQKY